MAADRDPSAAEVQEDAEHARLRAEALREPAIADVQRDLAEALAGELSGWPIGSGYYGTTVGTDDAREMVKRLLPFIDAAEKRAAAAALRDAGRGGHFTRDGQRWAADRAAALDPAGATSGETT